jgi:hypothetical protein
MQFVRNNIVVVIFTILAWEIGNIFLGVLLPILFTLVVLGYLVYAAVPAARERIGL